MYESNNKLGTILCSTGSNIAADNITLFCSKLHLNVLRVYSKTNEEGDLNIAIPEVE